VKRSLSGGRSCCHHDYPYWTDKLRRGGRRRDAIVFLDDRPTTAVSRCCLESQGRVRPQRKVALRQPRMEPRTASTSPPARPRCDVPSGKPGVLRLASRHRSRAMRTLLRSDRRARSTAIIPGRRASRSRASLSFAAATCATPRCKRRATRPRGASAGSRASLDAADAAVRGLNGFSKPPWTRSSAAARWSRRPRVRPLLRLEGALLAAFLEGSYAAWYPRRCADRRSRTAAYATELAKWWRVSLEYVSLDAAPAPHHRARESRAPDSRRPRGARSSSRFACLPAPDFEACSRARAAV